MSERCETCRFWRQFRAPDEFRPGISVPNGVCRRYASTRIYPCYGENPFGCYGSPWPWTAQDDWCGEWTMKKDED
jgi:hypothetical protein